MKRVTIAICIGIAVLVAAALFKSDSKPLPETRELWPNGAPGAKGTDPGDRPSISIHRPDASIATGAAIIVCPGGGYARLARHESDKVADWLSKRGVMSAVLRYRLGPRYRHPSPLDDVSRAVRMLRASASDFGIDPNKIGVWGFSAGGHLAATLATHFDDGDPSAEDLVERAGSRPDLAVLAYPVISMHEAITDAGSRLRLLGPTPTPALIESLSNETQVGADTPPTFIFHTRDDPVVSVRNSILFAAALEAAGVEYRLQLYDHGKHGVGLALDDPVLRGWTDALETWLRQHGFVGRAPTVPPGLPIRAAEADRPD